MLLFKLLQLFTLGLILVHKDLSENPQGTIVVVVVIGIVFVALHVVSDYIGFSYGQ